MTGGTIAAALVHAGTSARAEAAGGDDHRHQEQRRTVSTSSYLWKA